MQQYFRYYFNEPKEIIAGMLHSELNPFGIYVMKKSDSVIFADSEKFSYLISDGRNYSHWGFYSDMESIFHFKDQTKFDTGNMYSPERLAWGRAFADELDRQKIPYYLLAHTNHDTEVLIRGLTLEHEGIMNPQCNVYGVEDVVLEMIKGLKHKEHVFGKDYLENYFATNNKS